MSTDQRDATPDLSELPPLPAEQIFALSVKQGWQLHWLQQGLHRIATALQVDPELLGTGPSTVDDWDALIDATVLAFRAVREDAEPRAWALLQVDKYGSEWILGARNTEEKARKDLTTYISNGEQSYSVLPLYEHPSARVPEPAAEPFQRKWMFEKFADQMPALFSDEQRASYLKIADTLREHGSITELVAYTKLWAALNSMHSGKPSLVVETTDTPE